MNIVGVSHLKILTGVTDLKRLMGGKTKIIKVSSGVHSHTRGRTLNNSWV